MSKKFRKAMVALIAAGMLIGGVTIAEAQETEASDESFFFEFEGEGTHVVVTPGSVARNGKVGVLHTAFREDTNTAVNNSRAVATTTPLTNVNGLLFTNAQMITAAGRVDTCSGRVWGRTATTARSPWTIRSTRIRSGWGN